MPKCTIDHLESSFSSIRTIISKSKNSFLETLDSNFKKLMLEFNSEAITYCLEKYIGAELDYTTPGDRGIGRMTTYIPRFGAYFRKILSTLSHQELNELYLIIQDLCLRSYLAHALFVVEPVGRVRLQNGASLYEAWLPRIYVSDTSKLGQNLMAYISECTMPVVKEIYDFMVKHGMKGSILSNRDSGFPSKSKVNEILSYYVLAGFGLRFIEIGGR